MTVSHVSSLRSFNHIGFLVSTAHVYVTDLGAATQIADTIVYEVTGAIWQMARPDPDGMRGAILERRFSDGRIIEIAYVNERMIALPQLTLYRLQICMARANEGGLLLFDPCYEKILLVTTSEYLIASPRPRPRLPTFDSATTQSVRHFVREHCEVHRHWERTHHDFHTRFHHNDTPAVCVAGPERAMRYLADQYEDDGTGPLHLAMWHANRARMVSGDFNNYDMLRYVMDADVHDVFPDMLPQEIISAYVAQRYRTIDIVSFSPTPLPHHFAQWYHPVSDADDGIVVEEIELPEYTVDEEAMMNWIVNVDVEQFDEPDIVAV